MKTPSNKADSSTIPKVAKNAESAVIVEKRDSFSEGLF